MPVDHSPPRGTAAGEISDAGEGRASLITLTDDVSEAVSIMVEASRAHREPETGGGAG